MSDFVFAHPHLVHLLWLVLAATALLVWLERRGSDALSRLVSPWMQTRLVDRLSPGRRVARTVLLGASAAFAVLALMRPQWGLQFIETPRVGAEIMIALDVSKSMLAEDVTPNRLERAKADIRDLLSYLDGDQVGLIAFAGRASVLSPLTPDFAFLRMVLDGTGPASVTRGGTRLEEPIRKAVAGFRDTTDVSRSILLITDGEDHDSFPLEAAKEAAERGVRILAIGFGDERGAEIVMTDPTTGERRPLRDADGKIVVSRLDGDTLRQIALTTDGAYIPAGTGVLDLASIYDRHIAGLTRGRLDGRGRTVRNEAFQWAVLASLLCLAASVLVGSRKASTTVRAGARAATVALTLLASVADVPATTPGAGVEHLRAALTPRTAQAQTPPTGAARRPAADHGMASPALPAGALPTPPQPAAAPNAAAAVQGAVDNALDAAMAAKARREATAAAGGSDSADAADADAQASTSDGGAGGTTPHPTTPRETYNAGAAAIESGDFDRAEEQLIAARSDARTDAELRFRATFNLGWVDVGRADAALEEEPEQALESLRRAADWFRDAVSLRPSDDDARRNLEIVLKRALALADSLAKRDEDLMAVLAEVTTQQRELNTTLAASVTTASQADSPAEVERERSAFRDLAATQLEVLTAAEDLTDLVVAEIDAIRALGEEDVTPEQRVRAARLANASGYVHRARERMGQARSRMRRLEAEGAYRRAAAALVELARARDQLLEPLQMLEAILGAAMEVTRWTAMHEADTRGVLAEPAPEWLDADYLGENETSVAERAAELAAILDAGLEGAEQAETEGQEIPEEQKLFLDRVREASPLVGDAASELQAAVGGIEEARLVEALESQREGIDALVRAREIFLDVRGLVETMLATETQIASLLFPRPSPEVARDPEARKRWSELAAERRRAMTAPAAELQSRNVERGERAAVLIPVELASDPVLAEEAAKLLEAARDAMGRADEVLGRAVQGNTAMPARQAVNEALDRLTELRRLFFDVIERLKETLRREMDVADTTESIRGLAPTRTMDEMAEELGPLAPRQDELAASAAAIAEELSAQSQALGQSPPQDMEPEKAADMADRMTQASALVDAAGEHMGQSSVAMTTAPLDLDAARTSQDTAIAQMTEALELLAPPEECDNPQPSDDGSSDEQDEEKKEEEQQQDQQQAQGGQPEQEQPEPEEADPGQMLQGVRDREAQRREDNEERRRQHLQYEPVEKDW